MNPWAIEGCTGVGTQPNILRTVPQPHICGPPQHIVILLVSSQILQKTSYSWLPWS